VPLSSATRIFEANQFLVEALRLNCQWSVGTRCPDAEGMAKRDRSDKRGESEQGVDTVAKSQTTNLLTDLFQFF